MNQRSAVPSPFNSALRASNASWATSSRVWFSRPASRHWPFLSFQLLANASTCQSRLAEPDKRTLRVLFSIMRLIIACSSFLLCAANQCAAEAVRYICSYEYFAQPTGIERAKDFVMEFSHDTVTGDAFIYGNAGVSPLTVHLGTSAVTFLEFLNSGAVQVSIINQDGSSTHSRHTVIAGELVPSQYYGNCKSS